MRRAHPAVLQQGRRREAACRARRAPSSCPAGPSSRRASWPAADWRPPPPGPTPGEAGDAETETHFDLGAPAAPDPTFGEDAATLAALDRAVRGDADARDAFQYGGCVEATVAALKAGVKTDAAAAAAALRVAAAGRYRVLPQYQTPELARQRLEEGAPAAPLADQRPDQEHDGDQEEDEREIGYLEKELQLPEK